MLYIGPCINLGFRLSVSKGTCLSGLEASFRHGTFPRRSRSCYNFRIPFGLKLWFNAGF